MHPLTSDATVQQLAGTFCRRHVTVARLTAAGDPAEPTMPALQSITGAYDALVGGPANRPATPSGDVASGHDIAVAVLEAMTTRDCGQAVASA